ncbi:DUF1972 domain-containing protein [Sphingomonas mucosissima]|uniref:Glycosyl transferases group 1 n=1 Tax=Sphingomonas mucosissima TaxID=370959 RepID=A0A245ZDD0_9SPHN|nr:DUF1972 domain-containing protein [Sphingomonas mucosissima]OWK27713.1 glycosyl transferases group 1 [Sphingomonas mucosissima]
MFQPDVRQIIILGIRGVPAAHGGFETFAERLALYLRSHGWAVTVYCQGSASGVRETDDWNGVRRIHIPVSRDGALGTIEFDAKCVADVGPIPGTILTLGYNTGFLCAWLRLRGRRNLINMDGLEWRRAKYNLAAKAYLWLNERIACWSGNRLIADHPVIADHLATRASRHKILTIPYGGENVLDANVDLLQRFGVSAGNFFTVIARPEPENSVLEIVEAFSSKARGAKLLVLGRYDSNNAFQDSVLRAASAEVLFPGPVYDKDALAALRLYSIAYLHGHKVGGTNPSLVEALGAGNPVIAHDNPFNRWVAGDGGIFFNNAEECSAAIDRLLLEPSTRLKMSAASRRQWAENFTWEAVLSRYERALLGGQ